jgi:hypothetical protein
MIVRLQQGAPAGYGPGCKLIGPKVDREVVESHR